ncbi:MAG: hypothetical protein ACRDF4_06750 [Rhabdochlamydiaceae bacterium]
MLKVIERADFALFVVVLPDANSASLYPAFAIVTDLHGVEYDKP